MKSTKKMKVITILSCYFILMTLMLTGCGKTVKSEDQMIEDLYNNPNFYSQQKVTIENLSIIKRQTDKHEKKDIVFVTLKVGNDAVEGKISYILNYNLYDEGWILDDVSIYPEGEWEFKPLKSVEQSIADNTIKERLGGVMDRAGLGEFIFSDRIDNLNTCQLYYYVNESYTYLKSKKYYVENFEFNKESGLWEVGKIKVASERDQYDWDIEGTWYPDETSDDYSNSKYLHGLTVKIDNVNNNNAHILVQNVDDIYLDKNIEIKLENGCAIFDSKQLDGFGTTVEICIKPTKIIAYDRGYYCELNRK